MQTKYTAWQSVQLDEVNSTSDYIKNKLHTGEELRFPYVVSALRQTEGRGRLQNRSFYSPQGGLYFSAAFLPQHIACGAENITLACGAAVATALEKLCGDSFAVKWVNDVLYRGKKVAGILCESLYYEKTQSNVYIIGIGVNASRAALDGFMPEKVGALPKAVDINTLRDTVMENLIAAFSDTSCRFVQEYNVRLTVLGKRVEIVKDGMAVTATVLGASGEGLLCRGDDGAPHIVRTCAEVITDLYAASQEGE